MNTRQFITLWETSGCLIETQERMGRFYTRWGMRPRTLDEIVERARSLKLLGVQLSQKKVFARGAS